MSIFLDQNVKVLTKAHFTRDRSLTKVHRIYNGFNRKPPGAYSCRVQMISEVCSVILPVKIFAVINRPSRWHSQICRSSERDDSRGARNFGRSARDPLCELGVCLQPKTHAISDTDSPVSNRPKTVLGLHCVF